MLSIIGTAAAPMLPNVKLRQPRYRVNSPGRPEFAARIVRFSVKLEVGHTLHANARARRRGTCFVAQIVNFRKLNSTILP